MKYRKNWFALALAVCLCAMVLTGCGSTAASSAAVPAEAASSAAEQVATEAPVTPETLESALEEAAPAAEAASSAAESEEQAEQPAEESVSAATLVTVANVTSDGILDATEYFTDRDLTQTADLSDAEELTLSDGQDINITAEGVYVLHGTASNVTVYVEAEDTAKVQLVLDGVSITNDDFPCIYVKTADKVFVTTAGDSDLSVTGTFTADGETNTDGVIFSQQDLVLNGTATLTISSTDNGIVCKDDLKVTGGTYVISATDAALEANDSIKIAEGTFQLTAGNDAIHVENDDDDTVGYLYVCGGSFTIDAGDDAIHAVSAIQIDDGTFTINAAEGIEATYIQINGGTILVNATDDGINAAQKSSAYTATIEITDGSVTVNMGSGDTDGIDSNSDIIISGGTVDVTGQSAFDYDGTATYTGGTIIVNGEQVDSIPNQMMGGRGGFGGW